MPSEIVFFVIRLKYYEYNAERKPTKVANMGMVYHSHTPLLVGTCLPSEDLNHIFALIPFGDNKGDPCGKKRLLPNDLRLTSRVPVNVEING